MSISSWNPDDNALSTSYEIQKTLLLRFINFAKTNDWPSLAKLLTPAEAEEHQQIMSQPKEAWRNAVEKLNSDDIENLVRFFTEAEMQLNGWEAGSSSPVITLVKILRKRNCPPGKDLLLWIKAHSTNRFLPNGAL